MGKLLQNPKTPLAVVHRIKNYGRKVSEESREESVERHVANTVYYCAIAHALCFHEARITTLSNNELTKAFKKLESQKWIPRTLRSLFTNGKELCEKKGANTPE